MNTPKIFNKIANSNFAKTISNKTSQFATKLGGGIENLLEKTPKKDTFKKIASALEPTGSNNSFIPMAGIMLGGVVVPRIITAAKRNPNDKEATKDEIVEILFRDLQTIGIMLFALKSMNSIVANIATKVQGVPMVTKAYENIFDSKGIKEKGLEFVKHPIDKIKRLFKNIVATLHPTAGSRSLIGEEYMSKYYGYDSIEAIIKQIDDMPNSGGNTTKVFKKIMDSLIKKQNETIQELSSKGVSTLDKDGNMLENASQDIKNAKEILDLLNKIKENGYEEFKTQFKDDKRIQQLFINFFQDDKNALVLDAKRLDAVLRIVALGIESTYLGFGLPALNQKRLEKKYLNKKEEVKTITPKVESPLNLNHIKAQEIKLYSNFLNNK